MTNDKIFLLSVEEYMEYRDFIPLRNCSWWLRSPSFSKYSVAYVSPIGSTRGKGGNVDDDFGHVRPAIHTIKNVYDAGTKICVAGYTWVVIDKENGIAIAEMPIAIRRFDEESNNYETSEIRKWLLSWYKERCEYFGSN